MGHVQLHSEVFDIALHPTRPLLATALLSGHVSWYFSVIGLYLPKLLVSARWRAEQVMAYQTT